MKFNGFTNRETWVASCYLQNNFYYICDDMSECRNADDLENFITNLLLNQLKQNNGFAVDIIQSAINQINFDELLSIFDELRNIKLDEILNIIKDID